MIVSLFRRRSERPAIDKLYGVIMATALEPELYAQQGVPDSFEGRFESAALHMALTLVAMRRLAPHSDAAAQALVDRFFDGVDAAMRERGIGDTGVPRRMKKFLQGFYGRLKAYETALAHEASVDALAEALSRNLLDGQPVSAGLTARTRALHARLTSATLEALLSTPELLFSAQSPGRAA